MTNPLKQPPGGVTTHQVSTQPYLRELCSGLVDLEADDSARCCECGSQAMLYALDIYAVQWFTCPEHHGLVMLKLLRGELDDSDPPPPPLPC